LPEHPNIEVRGAAVDEEDAETQKHPNQNLSSSRSASLCDPAQSRTMLWRRRARTHAPQNQRWAVKQWSTIK
jgi:hypothetical protein